MRFEKYITEKRKNNVIVVDVQPMYESAIYFDMTDFTDFLKKQLSILYYYNGPDTVGSDTKNDIIRWLLEYADFDEELAHKLKRETIWYDKGYAFFRNWMDMGATEGFIKKAVRFMMLKKVNDSRDIESYDWEEEFPDDWDEAFADDMIYLPDIPINKLKKWSGSYIVGGGKQECLKEVQLLMSVFNIRAKVVKEFIY